MFRAVPLALEHHSASMTVHTDPTGGTQLTWITDFAPATHAAQLEALIDTGVQSMTNAFAQ